MRVSRYLSSMAFIALAMAQTAVAKEKTIGFDEKGKGFEVGYSYPAYISAMPKLKRILDREHARLRNDAKQNAAEAAKMNASVPKENVFEYTVDRQQHWQTVANLPGFLSLSSRWYTYDGGAHGMYGQSSKMWDKKTGKFIEPLSMFLSGAAFDREVQTSFCDLLDKQRSERRDGEKVDRSKSDDWMQACPTPSEYILLIGSSNGRTFDRLGIYVGPYGAGPYSEGEYEIDLPVTAKLLAAIKPQYRAVFSVAK